MTSNFSLSRRVGCSDHMMDIQCNESWKQTKQTTKHPHRNREYSNTVSSRRHSCSYAFVHIRTSRKPITKDFMLCPSRISDAFNMRHTYICTRRWTNRFNRNVCVSKSTFWIHQNVLVVFSIGKLARNYFFLLVKYLCLSKL